jgi:uncharacterized membrane protein
MIRLQSSFRTWRRFLAVILLPMLLSGCFASKEAVFDPAEAVTPFAASKYKVERYAEGQWKSEGIWPFTLDKNSYVLEDPTNGRITFRLFELDSDTYIVEESGNNRWLYGLMRVNNGSMFLYVFHCYDYKGADVANKYPPIETSEGYISECFFASNEQLFDAISTLREKADLYYRLTPIFEPASTASQPRAGAPTELEATTLKLCNKSPLDVTAIVHHRHRKDPSKQALSGWYEVPRGQCRDFGPFPKPQLSVFGVGQDGGQRIEWPGKSASYCISSRQTYRVVQDNETCILGEASKPFADVDTTKGSPATYTFFWK